MKCLISILVLFLFCATLASGKASLSDDERQQCFVPGECTDSFSLQILNSVDVNECLQFCQEREECNWFTYYPDPLICQLFTNCTDFDAEVCDGCLSGERDCPLVEPQCFIPGQCEGNMIVAVETNTEADCLTMCKSERQCRWFSFYSPGTFCFLFTECETLDESEEGFRSGERRCKEDVEPTTTTTPTTTTIGTSTTSEPVAVYSKVFVALGYDRNARNDIEIIDLLSSETVCQKPKNFSYENFLGAGELGFQGKPLICGGNNTNSAACHIYEDGDWKSSDTLNQGRWGFVMIKSPFQDGHSKLFLTGGRDISGLHLNSSEVLTEKGWQLSVPLPVTVTYHCMVTINVTSVMVIGGYQNGPMSGRSFLFNSETNIWSEGPTLITARCEHSCGLIRLNSQTQEKSFIVVGGYIGSSRLSSVEVLDQEAGEWRQGAKLPLQMCCAALVEDPSGGVVLIGGYGSGIGPLDTVYKLPHAGSDATWEEMPQKLKTKRHWPSAFFVSDEIAACSLY